MGSLAGKRVEIEDNGGATKDEDVSKKSWEGGVRRAERHRVMDGS